MLEQWIIDKLTPLKNDRGKVQEPFKRRRRVALGQMGGMTARQRPASFEGSLRS